MAEALSGAIGEQAQTYNATVVSVSPKAGYFLAFSNRFGNIKVLSRTNDDLKPGDRVFIKRAGPEKQAPYLYQGFGGGVGRTAPGIAPGTPIYVDPPNDGGTGTAPVGTIQYYGRHWLV